MKIRLLLVISLVVGIVSVTAPAVRADDLGLQPGGSILTLPPAQGIGQPQQGAAKEPLFNTAEFTCPTGVGPTRTTF